LERNETKRPLELELGKKKDFCILLETLLQLSYLPIIANQAINTQNNRQDITGGILNGALLPFV
jgi:hypothetical protein